MIQLRLWINLKTNLIIRKNKSKFIYPPSKNDGKIIVKETLKNKLDVDFKKYKILGACNPPNAYKGLQAETDIGLMLPCNVIVYEAEGGATVVAAVDPVASMQAIDNPKLGEIADEIRQRLHRLIDSL